MLRAEKQSHKSAFRDQKKIKAVKQSPNLLLLKSEQAAILPQNQLEKESWQSLNRRKDLFYGTKQQGIIVQCHRSVYKSIARKNGNQRYLHIVKTVMLQLSMILTKSKKLNIQYST